MKNAAVLSALSTVCTTANITPSTLLKIVAVALAETRCNCRTLPTGSAQCRACREATYLASIADQVDMTAALVAITEACGNVATALADLLPEIIEEIIEDLLDPDRCTCRNMPDLDVPVRMCPTCTAARKLDDLCRDLRAA